MQKTNVSPFLDCRRQKADGTYPIKLQVWNASLRRRKMFATGIDVSKEDYNVITTLTKKKKLTSAQKDSREKIDKLLRDAREISSLIVPFSFDEFENVFFGKGEDRDNENIFHHFKIAIEEYQKAEKVQSAMLMECTANAVISFQDWKKNRKTEQGKDPIPLRFTEITVAWLNDFVHWMTSVNSCSKSTCGFYCARIRIMFGRNPSIKAVHYPFGVGKFKIPQGTTLKRVLIGNEISELMKAKTNNELYEKARNFWFFSFDMNGANIKDILLLRWKNIDFNSGTIQWVREKTKNSTENEITIQAFISEHMKLVIEKYGNESRYASELVFPVLEDGLPAVEQRRRINNFIRWVNANVDLLCKENGLKSGFGTYAARHSWATAAINNGAPLSFVRDGLGHTNGSTTDKYLSSLPTNAARELSKKIVMR